MKLRRINIQNFRGIKTLDWRLTDSHLFCLIGRGDSTKTTILDAIRHVFNPQWNPTFVDSDFHLSATSAPISIEIAVGDLSDEFCAISKYGLYLRGWNTTKLELHDEPDNELEPVLSFRLTISKDLEPKWKVVCDREPEGVDFKSTDRAKVGVGLIGSFSDRQLTWSAGTPLARLTDAEDLNESLIDATRAARKSLDSERAKALKSFDAAALKSETVAKTLGVPVQQAFKANLDLNSIAIKMGGLTLHDGEMPLRQLGLGSRRMLLTGLQKENLQAKHVTLLDEVELGLEPQRIARLIKHIKDDTSGQYFVTTHSPTVLRELTIREIYVVHKQQTGVKVLSAADQSLSDLGIQGHFRSSAEAFLSTKVIVCEGATEVGFLRGLDNLWAEESMKPFSYLGAVLLDARGASRLKDLSTGFKALSYEVFVFADGDAPTHFSTADATELRSKGINVVMWSDGLALEQRAMLDLPWRSVLASVKHAATLGYPVLENVQSKLNGVYDADIDSWRETPQLRKAIGDAAKSSSWFKSVTDGQSWVAEIAPVFADRTFATTDLGAKLALFRTAVSREG